MKERLPFLFVLLAAILWGTTGTAQTFAPENAHPLVIGAVRLGIGGLTLLLFVLLQGKFTFEKWPLKETLIASVSMACFQPFFFSAVQMTGVAIGTVVAIGSAPVLSGLLEWLLLKKRPGGTWWMATCLSIVGCLLLFVNKDMMLVKPVGVLMALGAGLAFAIYTLVSKQLLKQHAPEAVVAVVFVLSALFLSPFLFFYDMTWLTTMEGIAVSLHLGIIATGIAYLLFSKGLMAIPASSAVTLSLGEPLTATMLGVFLVGEQLTLISWIGVGLLLLGIVLLTLTARTERA